MTEPRWSRHAALAATLVLACSTIPTSASTPSSPTPPHAKTQSSATEWHDDFSHYAVGTGGDPHWLDDAIHWTMDGRSFAANGLERSMALAADLPRGGNQTIEATVTVHSDTGSDWKTAGIVIADGDDDYWQLALVESPDPTRTHFLELDECRHGVWNSATSGVNRLPVVQRTGADCRWVYDHPYHLRLQIDGNSIAGTVLDRGITQVGSFRFTLAGDAVRAGTGGVESYGFDAHFLSFDGNVETPEPAPAPSFPAFTQRGISPTRDHHTGFFHLARHAGVCWLVNPNGEDTFALGVDHVNYYDFFCEKLRTAPYHNNCVTEFHGDEAAWGRSTTSRLASWGFNALGTGASPTAIHGGLPDETMVSFGYKFAPFDSISPRTTWTGFPNVFSPRWPAFCDNLARRICAPRSTDPWLIGYFLDNELEWYGKDGAPWGLFDECLKKPAGDTAKEAALAFLKGRYPTIDALNNAWQIHAASWDDLDRATDVIESTAPAANRDRLDFVGIIAQRYFATTTKAIKRWDRNHLILGCRFAGSAPDPALPAAGRTCDVVTVNFYGHIDLAHGTVTDMPDAFDRLHALCQAPMMITEWSFPAADSGLPNDVGAGQRVPTQTDRGRCFTLYQTALLRLPYLVGSNWFMWVDEPALGISSSFPEDSNYGLVDVNNTAYAALVDAATRVQAQACAIHAASGNGK